MISSLKNNKFIYLAGIKLIQLRDSVKVSRLKKYTLDKKKKYISKLYKKRTGYELDWTNLESYTEKMQWAKLYEVLPEKSRLADKYAVREWVKEKIGEEFLIPVLGVWDDFDKIDFERLPKSFVLKVTNGSGTNIIVKDKDKLDKVIAKARITYWMKVDRSYIKGFETHYSKIKPRIIAEQYIEHEGEDLQDYKFLCFDGKVYYCWVDVGRYHEHKRNVYDLNWNLQTWNQYNYGNTDGEIPKPENFEKMVKLAGVLCQGFSHVRVDFYNVEGKIYFGEMTFTNGSGFEPIEPRSADIELGKLWNLNMDGNQ